MKTNGTRIMLISLLLYFLLVLMSYSAIAQPDYYFTNKSLVSGTDRQTGAVYRFTSVKPGVDALVTITSMTSGIALNDIDGGSGFAEAFQPVITVNANTSAYVEFKIDFVIAGTSTPMVMAEVPATCIDVDGKTVSGKKVCEFDMISMAPASYINYDLAGGELSVVTSPGWVTGTNTAGIDYAGVDTVARQVMFTAVSASISTMTIRVGANNQTSSSQQRLRSVYFKKFTYPNAFLAMPVLQYFRGAQQGQKINLSCGLSSCANLARIIIERGNSYQDLQEIGEIWVDNQQASGSFTYNDQPGNEGPSYYRLKLIGLNQEVQYSQVIVFRSTGTTSTNAFQVYPTVMHSTGSMSFDAAQNTQALVQIVDFNGRLIQQQDWQLQQGRNTLMLTGADNWSQGQYIALLKVNGNIYQQKIIRQ